MGVLKDGLHTAVWQYLRTQPRFQTLLLSLNAPHTGPQSIRQALAALRENGKTEGMKKSTGLQAVLRERPDLFHTHTNDRGHLIIGLTPSAQEHNPDDGLPPPGPGYVPPAAPAPVPVPPTMLTATPAVASTSDACIHNSGEASASDLSSLLQGFSAVTEEQAADPAFAEQFAEALKAVEEHGWSELTQGQQLETADENALRALAAPEAKVPGLLTGSVPSVFNLEGPAAKKQKVGSTYSVGPKQGKGVTKGKNGWYQDIVWTPQLAARQALEKQKDAALARSIFNACEIFGGQCVTLSQLGSDYNVSQIKKDPQFKNHKLIDIIRYHEDVFEVIPDPAGQGGFVVKLQPGAEAGLPDAETYLDETNESTMMLPERIEEPRAQKDKLQALRIELIHALHRRGGKVALQELGQDQKVQKIKSVLAKGQKLIEFIRMFSGNFTVNSDDTGQMMVQVASTDVHDQSMIDNSIFKSQVAAQHFRDKGKGRGGSRQPMSSSRSMPSSHERDSQYSGNLGYGRLGAAPSSASAQDSALATASALSTLIQHSIASAYGGVGAAQPAMNPYAQYAAATAHTHPGHPGYPGFAPAPTGFSQI